MTAKRMKVRSMYQSQLNNSKERGHVPPGYTEEEFTEWLWKQYKFHDLYDMYERADFDKDLAPSIDRIDDHDHYRFGNVQVMTWDENRIKGYDRKDGKGKKVNLGYGKKVIIVHDRNPSFMW